MILSIFTLFFIVLLLGVPIGISLGIASLSASVFNPGLPAGAGYIFRNMVTGIDSYSLLAIPLFILSGNIMAKGGISKKLFNFFAYFIGDKTGGMPIAAIITCLFYGAISGSAPATVAAVGTMTYPLLTELGYDRKVSIATIAVAGGLGVIIPPSVPFIIYGTSAGASVGDLFTAGIVPGVLIGAFLCLYTYFYYKKHGEDTEKLKQNVAELRKDGFWGIFKDSFWALMTPVIILGGIYGGIVTPTEAANLSVVYSLIVSIFIYKSMKLEDLAGVTKDTIKTAAPVLLVVATATVFGRVLTIMQAPQTIAAAITGAVSSKVAIILIILAFLLVVGMFMETLAAILILTPIFLPIVTAIGMDPIHFGVVTIVVLAIGFVTPPVGLNLYVASSISGIPVMEVAKKATPYMIAFVIAALLIAFVPQISLVLLP